MAAHEKSPPILEQANMKLIVLHAVSGLRHDEVGEVGRERKRKV